MNSLPASSTSRPVRYQQALTFAVGPENYGVDLLHVQEIRCWSPVTRIPHAPPQVLGVLNLRGKVVPILDLRIRFGQGQPGYAPNNVIIVLSIPTDSGTRECGLVVDSVSDVVALPPEGVMPAPAIRAGDVGDCVSGLISADEQLIMLLDISTLLADELQSALPPSSLSH